MSTFETSAKRLYGLPASWKGASPACAPMEVRTERNERVLISAVGGTVNVAENVWSIVRGKKRRTEGVKFVFRVAVTTAAGWGGNGEVVPLLSRVM